MAILTGRLAPDTILEQSGFSPIATLAMISEDASTPDGTWATMATNGSGILRVGFPTPPPQVTGTQTIKIALRNQGQLGAGATATINVKDSYSGSILTSQTSVDPNSLSGVIRTLTFDASAFSGNPKTGQHLEVEIAINGSSSGKNKGTIDVGAVSYYYNSDDSLVVVKPNIPTDTIPASGETHNNLNVSAIVSHPEGKDVKLRVDWFTSTDPFSSNFTESVVVPSGSRATVSLTSGMAYEGDTFTVSWYTIDATNSNNQSDMLQTSFTYMPSTEPQEVVTTDLITPTELFPFNNSAWKSVKAEAIVDSVDGRQVQLVAEVGKMSDLSDAVRVSSTFVSSGSKATVDFSSVFAWTSGETVYWRAYTKDSSNNISNKTSIYNYAWKPSGNFAPDGTPFMQQGDPNTHIKVIDISQYQEEASAGSGGVNWQSIKDSGVNHVYLRAYGSARGTGGDNMFETFITEANAVGIKTGGYFYTMPSVPLDLAQARAEADLFIAKLQAGYGTGQYGDLMPVMDLEDNSGVTTAGQTVLDLSVEDMLQWANEFRNYFEAQTGRTLGLYTGDYFVRDLRNNFNHDDTTGQAVAGTSGNLVKDMPLWIQGYTAYDRYKGYVMPSCGGWTKWYLFQWSETGTQVGISGNVDQNLSEPIEWWLEPSDVTGLAYTSNGTEATITWNANTEEDIHGYHIYLNDVWHDYVTGATNTTYTFTGLAGTNTFGVSANDVFEDNSRNRVSVTYAISGGTGGSGIAPKVTIVSVSRTKISDEPEFDRANITFTFDVDTKSYTVNVNGVDHTTGVVAHSGGGKLVSELSTMTVGDLSLQTVQQISIIVAGYEIVAEIDWTELSNGDNRVNIYGQSTDGTWTPYDTGADTIPPDEVTNLQAGVVTMDSVELTWTASTSSDIQDYIIYQGDVEIGQTVDTTFMASSLQPATMYTFKVSARDTSGNISNGVTITATTNDYR